MSIATKRGDDGTTGLIGDVRVSKANLRVEAGGSVDELNATLGFARSLCSDPEVAGWTETIQRTLFKVGSALFASGDAPGPTSLSPDDVTWLTELVHRVEAMDGILSDWALPGAHRESAAYEVARTVCRRAERGCVRLHESGDHLPMVVLSYMNRLSDLIWLFGRLIEVRAGVHSKLREEGGSGPKWSRAW